MKKQKSQAQMQKEVDFFNSTIKVGDTVNIKNDKGEIFQDTIRYPASIMGGHTPIVWLFNRGSYLLDRVISKAVVTLLLTCCFCSGLKAQTKDTIHLKLTLPQIQAIAMKVDSLQMMLSQTSTLPANQLAQFNQRVMQIFAPLYMQVEKQMKKKEGKK